MTRSSENRLARFICKLTPNDHEDLGELFSGAFNGLIARVLAVASVFAFNVYIGRNFGASGSGLFFLSLSITSACAVLSRFGTDSPVVRLAAQMISSKDWADLRSFHRASVFFVALLGAVFSVVIWLFAPYLAEYVFSKPELSPVLSYMAWALVPMALVVLYSHYFRALKSTGISLFARSALAPLIALAILLALPPFARLDYLAIVFAGSAVTAALYLAYEWRRRVPAGRSALRLSALREALSSGKTLLLPSLMDQIVQPWAALVLLGFWGTAAEVGWFGAASRVAALVAFAVLPVIAIFSPKAAVLSKEGRYRDLSRLSHRATLLILMVAMPVGILILVAAEGIMGIFGDDFRSGAGVLVIVALGQVINAVTGPARALLLMSGFDREYRFASLMAGCLNLVSCLLLIPKFGVIGAAWSSAIGLAAVNLLSALLVWIKLRIDPFGLYQP
ncbi:MAG: polysaccharide biosynthesis C-terminal domain-containing protein, partial [Gammaproteobacteria bacterium]|nr:polysaccharide biosynthesis C-terminal domain-containing protein [Gammaproteobacteria bacterium]